MTAPDPQSRTRDTRRARLDAWIYRHRPLTHAIKTALATLIGLLVSALLSRWVDNPQWIVITIVVVMTMLPNLGGIMMRAMTRLVATLVAAAIALTVIYVSDEDPLTTGTTLVAGVAIFTFLAQTPKYRQVGVMCAVTLAVLLQFQEGGTEMVLWRGIDILIGAAIALGVAVFVFPIRASREMRFHMADTVESLGEIVTLAAADEETPEPQYEQLEDTIAKGIRAQRETLPLALIERKAVRNHKACLEHMMRSQRVILGLSRTLRRSYSHSSLGEATIGSTSGLDEVRSRLSRQLTDIAEAIRLSEAPELDPQLKIDHADFKVSLKQATRSSDTDMVSPQAFAFAMEQIIMVTESIQKDTCFIAFDDEDDEESIDTAADMHDESASP